MSPQALVLSGGLCLAALFATAPTSLSAREPIAPSATSITNEIRETEHQIFTLANGLQVLVLPDKRGTVVTHILNYRVGAADEQPGETGLSHFFEHLMFKATRTTPSGHYSRAIERIGGQHNASAHQDITTYYARVDKSHLEMVMTMEADRMVNLLIDDEEVLREREVIKEERRTRVDNEPSSRFYERLQAITFLNHPYRRPVIGWMHEIAALTPASVRAFYQKYYGPQNAVLIVAGDVAVDDVKAMAEKTYGAIAKRGVTNQRGRPIEPERITALRLTREDPLATHAQFTRNYVIPALTSQNLREVAATSMLMHVIGNGIKSRIYQAIVVKQQLASSAGASSSFGLFDSSNISIWATAAAGKSPEAVEKAIDALIADVIQNGITAEELTESKAESRASLVYSRASQFGRANMYGWNLAQGRTPQLVDALDAMDADLTIEDLKAAAAKALVSDNSITGWLLPKAETPPVVPNAAAHQPTGSN